MRIAYITGYYKDVYMKSGRFVLPLLILMIWTNFILADGNSGVVENTPMLLVFLFYIMMWVGISFSDIENEVSENILILKMRSATSYHISRIIFIFAASAGFSFIMCIMVLMKSVYSGNLYIGEEIIFLILSILAGTMGGVLSLLFQRRLIRNKKNAMFYIFCTGIFAMMKLPMNIKLPWTKTITWIFPPIHDAVDLFSREKIFLSEDIAKAVIIMAGYTLAVGVIQIFILKRKK